MVGDPDRARARLGGRQDPVTFLNEKPVGTGPFKFESFNPQQLVCDRNPDYWQADKIKVQELVYTKAERQGQVDQLRLADGEYDWNAMYVPNIEQVFVAKDPEHNHYWFPAGGSSISLCMNLTKAPFNDVEFRRGMAYAIDRDKSMPEGASSATWPRPARPASSCPASRTGSTPRSRTRATSRSTRPGRRRS